MKKSALLLLLLMSSFAFAHEGNFSTVKQLLKERPPCDELTDAQLEEIGDYAMELMHPGEQHDAMDAMMGEQNARLMHISMARTWYCGESDWQMSQREMGMMSGQYSQMMGWNGMGGTMMRSSAFGFVWLLLALVLWALVIGGIVIFVIWIFRKLTGQPLSWESAEDILKKRYAKGELTKQEYERMKKQLRD